MICIEQGVICPFHACIYIAIHAFFVPNLCDGRICEGKAVFCAEICDDIGHVSLADRIPQQEDIAVRTAGHDITAGPAIQNIQSGPAKQHIITIPAIQQIVAISAIQTVITIPAMQQIITIIAIEYVIARLSIKAVGAEITAQMVNYRQSL